jgi:flagellin-like hook-associated protein FlgL
VFISNGRADARCRWLLYGAVISHLCLHLANCFSDQRNKLIEIATRLMQDMRSCCTIQSHWRNILDADGSNVRSIFGFLNDRDRALKALRAVNRPMDTNRAIVNAFAAKQALRDAAKRLEEADRSLTLSDAQRQELDAVRTEIGYLMNRVSGVLYELEK